MPRSPSRLHELPRTLGYAGLLPQAGVAAMLVFGPGSLHFAALSLGFAYAALILSFVGGMWWGLAAQTPSEPPAWTWLAAVVPSLIALATALPWAIGAAWPGPSLGVLALSLLGSLWVDRRLLAKGITPVWWMSLRIPLSIGLGILTLLAAAFA